MPQLTIALLNQEALTSITAESSHVFFDDIDISLMPEPPEAAKDMDKILALIESIKEHGVMSPASLRINTDEDKRIVVLDGLSRIEAIRLLRRTGNPRHLFKIKLPCVADIEVR